MKLLVPAKSIAALACVVALMGCNVVPPLDCVLGVERPGCHRDANGIYHYLYTSPLLPAPNSDAIPVGYLPAAPYQPSPITTPVQIAVPTQPTHTTCSRNGDFVNCTSY
jgi:hypothetical protein